MNTAIITVNYKTPWHIKNYVQSVFTHTKNFHLFLVQNDPDDESIRVVKRFQQTYPDQITVITNNKNLGYVGGINSAYKQAMEYERVAFVNSDIIVTKGWLDELNKVLDEHDTVSQVTCDFSHYYPEHLATKIAKRLGRNAHRFALMQFSSRSSDQSEFRADHNFYNFCSGACNLTRTKYFKKLGYFLDPNIVHGYGDDFDLTYYLRQFGDIGVTNKSYVIHFVNASLNTLKTRNELKEKVKFLNRLYVVHKWRKRIQAEFDKLSVEEIEGIKDRQEVQIMLQYFALAKVMPNFEGYMDSIPAKKFEKEFLG